MPHNDDRPPDRPGGDDPGRGRRLGIDVGSVRIGVAVSDPDGILATPVETVPGMPPVLDSSNLYSGTAADRMSPAVAGS